MTSVILLLLHQVTQSQTCWQLWPWDRAWHRSARYRVMMPRRRASSLTGRRGHRVPAAVTESARGSASWKVVLFHSYHVVTQYKGLNFVSVTCCNYRPIWPSQSDPNRPNPLHKCKIWTRPDLTWHTDGPDPCPTLIWSIRSIQTKTHIRNRKDVVILRGWKCTGSITTCLLRSTTVETFDAGECTCWPLGESADDTVAPLILSFSWELHHQRNIVTHRVLGFTQSRPLFLNDECWAATFTGLTTWFSGFWHGDIFCSLSVGFGQLQAVPGLPKLASLIYASA